MENNKISVAVTDDHPIARKGLIEFIREFDEFDVVLEAANGKQLIEILEQAPVLPDISLLDIKMPVMDGYETAAVLKEKFPSIKVLAVSVFDSEQSIIKMLRNGARGYILKESDPVVFRKAMLAVYYNGYYYSELVSGQLVDAVQSNRKLDIELTDRETEFLKLCCTDLKYSEIAEQMKASTRTVDGYRETLFDKLHIKSRSGLVIYALSMGLG